MRDCCNPLKAILHCGAISLSLVLAWSESTAQEARTLYMTAGMGTISYTDDFSTHLWETPNNPGLVARVGAEVAFKHPTIAFGAEYERSSVSQQYDPRRVGICRNFNPPDVCDGEPSDLYAVTFMLRWRFGTSPARVTPYLVLGGGWMGERNVRSAETVGPKTDLGVGLALNPFMNRAVQVAVEPRYTFFYFPAESDEKQPSHVSVAVVTRIRLKQL